MTFILLFGALAAVFGLALSIFAAFVGDPVPQEEDASALEAKDSLTPENAAVQKQPALDEDDGIQFKLDDPGDTGPDQK